MKVLFVSNYLYLDGPPIALSRLVRELKASTDLEISVFSYLDGPVRAWYESIGIRPAIQNLFDQTVDNVAQMVKLIKKEKPDLVVSNMLDSINACFAANICKTPNIFYVHEDWPEVNLSTLHLFAFKVADQIVFPTKYQSGVYHPVLEGVPVKTINYGLTFSEFSPGSITESREEIGQAFSLPAGKKIVSIFGIVCPGNVRTCSFLPPVRS